MLKGLASLLILLTFVSCGEGNEDNEDIFGSRSFEQAEVESVASICNALADKRIDFETRADSSLVYRNRVLYQGCSDSSATTRDYTMTFRSPLGRSGDYYWEAPTRSNYFRDVVTDQTAPVSYICQLYQNGDSLNTTIDVGETRFHFKPSKTERQAALVISTLAKSGDSYERRVVEGMVIDTVSSNVTYGHLVDREIARDCGNGVDEQMRQTRL